MRTQTLQIANEVLMFIAEQGAKTVVMMGAIIGCPHEAGIDYREGTYCPRCLFWAGRNRWTGELIH